MTLWQTIQFSACITGAVVCFARMIYLMPEFFYGRRFIARSCCRASRRQSTARRLRVLCLAGFCLSADGQTNQAGPSSIQHPASSNAPAIVITTNLVTAAPVVRVVNGVAYNSAKSPVWEKFIGTVQTKRNGILIVDTYQLKSQSIHPRAYGGGIGSYIGGPEPKSFTQKWREPSKTIAITNIPDYAVLVDGQDIDTELMRVGIYEADGHTMELWDRGTLYRSSVIKTNRVKMKAKP